MLTTLIMALQIVATPPWLVATAYDAMNDRAEASVSIRDPDTRAYISFSCEAAGERGHGKYDIAFSAHALDFASYSSRGMRHIRTRIDDNPAVTSYLYGTGNVATTAENYAIRHLAEEFVARLAEGQDQVVVRGARYTVTFQIDPDIRALLEQAHDHCGFPMPTLPAPEPA